MIAILPVPMSVYFGGNPISWSSKKQRSIACSSTEVEFRVIAAVVSEICWIRNLLVELGLTFSKPILHCDNLGAAYLCSNPIYHSKMKHVEVDFYFVRDKIAVGLLFVSHIPSEN